MNISLALSKTFAPRAWVGPAGGRASRRSDNYSEHYNIIYINLVILKLRSARLGGVHARAQVDEHRAQRLVVLRRPRDDLARPELYNKKYNKTKYIILAAGAAASCSAPPSA